MLNITKESSTSLRNLLDNLLKHFRALNNLGPNTDDWDPMLIFVMSMKFDKNTDREWEEHNCNDEFLYLTDLYDFLRSRAIFF